MKRKSLNEQSAALSLKPATDIHREMTPVPARGADQKELRERKLLTCRENSHSGPQARYTQAGVICRAPRTLGLRVRILTSLRLSYRAQYK